MNVYKWAQLARVGERTVYHRGPALAASTTGGRTALEAHSEGLVFLAQRKEKGITLYEATKVSPKTAKVLGILPSQNLYQRKAA